MMGKQWNQLEQIVSTLLHTDNHTSISSVTFYRPNVLRNAQPTMLNILKAIQNIELQLYKSCTLKTESIQHL